MSSDKNTKEYEWEDLPKPLNCFTTRSASMVDLKKKKTVRDYSANTRITVIQKCTTETGTLYRTKYAKENDLDWAFKASAFGLPNEKAPSAPYASKNMAKHTHTSPLEEKQTFNQKEVLPDGGAGRKHGEWFKKLFRRKNG